MKEKKEKIVAVRVSEREYKEIEGNASKMGLNISTYLRVLGLKGKN